MSFLPLLLSTLAFLASIQCDKTWLTNLPNSKKLNTLAFIGTHDTATYGTAIRLAQTQAMNMKQQLEAGVRVFDMRVRRTDNIFAMHHGAVFLGLMFGQLIDDVRDFLQRNPQEFVIMFMQEEHTAFNSNNDCHILKNKYMREYPGLFVTEWSIDNTIGKYRGKILLARGDRGFYGCTKTLECKMQNEYEFKPGFGKDEKLWHIKRLQLEVSSAHHDRVCYINYLSANGDWLSTPALLSGHAITYAPFSSTKVPGINDIFLADFHNPRNTLYIVMADYPNQQLIDKIADSN